MQPPSRGCVLKLKPWLENMLNGEAAAFARLCVETIELVQARMQIDAAAFARLCVETSVVKDNKKMLTAQPPSRGCVLKLLRLVILSP